MRFSLKKIAVFCCGIASIFASCRSQTPQSNVASFFSAADSTHADVYKISITFADRANSMCSAVAISENTLLTAKHCFQQAHLTANADAINALSKNVLVSVGGKDIAANGVFVLDDKIKSELYIDLALVRFADSIFPTFAHITENAPADNKISVSGFGRTGYVSDHAYNIVFYKDATLPQELFSLPAYDDAKKLALTNEHKLYIGSIGSDYPVAKSTEYQNIINKVQAMNAFEKRSGASVLANNPGNFATEEMWRFVSKMVLKNDLDLKWFKLISLLTPESIVDDAQNSIAISTGDSGGPMFDSKNNLIGIAQGVDSAIEDHTVTYTSYYTNIMMTSVRNEFFVVAKQKGYSIPQVLKSNQQPAPVNPNNSAGPLTPSNPNANSGGPSTTVENSYDVVVALASAENSNGDYYLAVASREEFPNGWFCPSSDLQLCGIKIQNNESLPRLMYMQSNVVGRSFLRTSTKAKISEPGRNGFSIILRREDGSLVGTAVTANKIK